LTTSPVANILALQVLWQTLEGKNTRKARIYNISNYFSSNKHQT